MGRYRLTWPAPDFYAKCIIDEQYQDAPILYKYRDWKNPKHRKLLTESVIYLARPDSFEDEFDCHVPEDFPTQEELPSFFLDLSYTVLSSGCSNMDRINFVKERCVNSPLANPEERDALAESLFHEHSRRFGVLSLTADARNDLLWEKYGANHQGFCIGYRRDILEQYVGGAGPVIYTDELPHIKYFRDDVMTQHIKNTFFKLKKWSFEKEYRVHKSWKDSINDDDRNIHIPADAIAEVILGKNMSKEFVHEISTLVRTKYPKAIIRYEGDV